MDYNDYELVYLVSENDESATEILLKKYDKLIWSICYSCTRRFFNYDYVDFEDIVQEVRVALYYAIKRYNPNCEFLFYTFAILVIKRKALALLYGRYRKKLDIISYDNEDVFYEPCIEKKDYPDFITIEKELEELLIKFKCTLDFEDAAIFDLRFSSFSYADISKILDISVKSVDNKLSKIRNKLKKYLLKT